MNLEVFRKEIKYIATVQDFCRMEPELSACLYRDPNDKGDGYEIRSLYFDSYSDSDCRDVLDGLENKQKIRIRIYDPRAPFAKLEYKCKTGTDGRKQSVEILRREALQMMEENYECLLGKGDVGKELYAKMVKEAYQPKVMVAYRRQAYLYPSNHIRVTFDTHVSASADRWTLYEKDPCLEPVLSWDVGVLEVKYDGFLYAFIKDMVDRVNTLPVANSKYVQSRLLY